jgi:hypothetical protein
MPCLNEAETLAGCIRQAQQALRDNGIAGEVIVADNGSSDGSIGIAEGLGARVVRVARQGYGNALMGGISAAQGRYVLLGDADGSYDFSHLPRFLAELRAGADLVMGNRFRGGIEPGAMPALHRYLGNPVLSAVGRLFFASACADFHCGLRGFSKPAYARMNLRTTGMEFASEMVVKASLFGLRIVEVPTTLKQDGRSRTPHLRTWRDGWRHLRFLLLYSPRWLFLVPGSLLMLLGTGVGLWLLPGPRVVGRVTFDVHTLVYAAMAVLLGFQAIAFAVFTKVFVIAEGLLPQDPRLDRLFRYIKLEIGLVVGAVLMVAGLAGSVGALGIWGARHFGPLDIEHTLRLVIPSALVLTLGFEIILTSFFLSVLGMSRR